MSQRFRPSLALAAVVVFATVFVSARARADDAEQARFHDALAREHYGARRFEQAIREFFIEQRLAPNPRVQFNIALCFDQLRREDDAYLFFREYLARTDDDAGRRQRAEAAIARLEPRVARVSVVTEPVGATIYVDGRDYGSYGTSPRVLVLPPGPHALFFQLAGHRDAQVDVEAIRGQAVNAVATLTPITGALEVISPVAGRVVARDAGGRTTFEGAVSATTSNTAAPLRVQMPPGDYEVALFAEGYDDWRGLVRVVARERAQVVASPTRTPAPTGDLTVTASAAGALIEIDGDAVGFAPSVIARLPIGRHDVRLSHPGLEPWSGEVTIGGETRSWLTVSLVRPSETTRSPVTWLTGGVGLASLTVGAVLGGLALASQSRFATLEAEQAAFARGMGPEPTGSLAELRGQQRLWSAVADVLLSIGGAALVAAIVLFFATEETEAQRSQGTFTEGEQ